MRDIILFGYGKNGKAVSAHLDRKRFLIVVYDEEELEEAKQQGHLNVEIFDNKILDEDLKKIGIEEAKIAICMLEDEARNMFLALSIRNINPNIKIIAKSNDSEYEHRYRLAGVNQIINSYEITANRIDSILKKPITLEFIHNIVFEDNDLVFAQVDILKDSFLDGRYLDDIELQENYNLIPIGIVDREKNDNLELILGNHKLDAGDVLVVIGDRFEVDRLKEEMKDSVQWHLQ